MIIAPENIPNTAGMAWNYIEVYNKTQGVYECKIKPHQNNDIQKRHLILEAHGEEISRKYHQYRPGEIYKVF